MRKAVVFLMLMSIPICVHDSGVRKIDVSFEYRWEKFGLPDPSILARLVIAESSGNPLAVSSKGAVGLCQIMPSLARSLGADPARLTEPDYNLMLGARWLGVLIQRYGVDGALRAYNAGETARHLWYTPAVNAYVAKINEGV